MIRKGASDILTQFSHFSTEEEKKNSNIWINRKFLKRNTF